MLRRNQKRREVIPIEKEARYYEKLDEGTVRCMLCPQYCVIKPDQAGICRSRRNVNGELRAVNYGSFVSMGLDPIEKKPLYHFHPGRRILSIGNNGCNLKCKFCQNWEISQTELPTKDITPEKLAELCLKHDSFGTAYTYAEPLIWFEFLLDASSALHSKGLKNVLVTNGMINEGPLKELLPLIDAWNIDLKSSRDEFYKENCSGFQKPVLNTIKSAYEAGCHVEVTNLIIPTLNDSDEDIQELIDFIASVGTDIPLHFSRYFPHYKMNIKPTPVKTLTKARRKALEKLDYCYVGNVMESELNSTFCPSCGKEVVSRSGYCINDIRIKAGRCAYCGEPVNFRGL